MKIRIMAVTAAVFLLFCGCSEKKAGCTLKVTSSYSGWGEDGHFLGSGEFTEEIQVSAGDILYEDYSGHWVKDTESADYDTIAEIKNITPEDVAVAIYEENKTKGKNMKYTAWTEVESRYVVCDGENYKYKISFHDYSEK